jgi:hypothetical protein
MKNMSILAALTAISLGGCSMEEQYPRPLESEPVTAPNYIGQAATPKPMPGIAPVFPYLAPHGSGSMHSDGYNSDVHANGPLGANAQVITRDHSKTLPGGMCATTTFNRDGKLISLCANMAGFSLNMFEPKTLEQLAYFQLPRRPSSFEALVKRNPAIVMEDTSGGAYYFLDHKDRVVLADSNQHIRRLAHRNTIDGSYEFYEDGAWDLSDYVPTDCLSLTNWFPGDGGCDPIVAVMPGPDGLIWWVTRYGTVGTLDPNSGRVALTQLEGEEIQNGFSVDLDAMYIVSDHRMYAMRANAEGVPQVLWQESYDRGSGRKIGTINQGSGTTPTLIGDDYLTITDNADGRINLLVYKRKPDYQGERLVCTVPLFKEDASVTDNSMIGWGRSIILENNFGYKSAVQQKDWSTVVGGITRIDIREDESGCDVIWQSTEKAPSNVPKMSSDNGLAYFYTFELQDNGIPAWYFMALDAHTGKTVYKVLTGAGKNFDNNWAPISLGSDGTAYIGTLSGMISISDGS